jgi:hypothetical protein
MFSIFKIGEQYPDVHPLVTLPFWKRNVPLVYIAVTVCGPVLDASSFLRCLPGFLGVPCLLLCSHDLSWRHFLFYCYDPFPFGAVVQLPPSLPYMLYAVPRLFQTPIVLVLLLVWCGMCCVLHMQQRIKMVPMDLSHPFLYHLFLQFLTHH